MGDKSIPLKGIIERMGASTGSVTLTIMRRYSLVGRGLTQLRMTRAKMSQM